MKKLVLTSSALVAFAVAAFAGPLDTKGIPADAVGILHLDIEAGAKSKITQAIKSHVEQDITKEQAGQKAYEAAKKETGFDPDKDLYGITVGGLGDSASEEPSFVVVFRGKFSPEKINAFAKGKSAASTEDKLTLINVNTLIKAFDSSLADEDIQDTILTVVDTKTAILADNKGNLKKALAALKGPSFTAPAALTAFGKQVPNTVLLAYVNGSAFPQQEGSPIPPVESIFAAIGESATDAQIRIAANFANESGPAQINGLAQMYQGMMQAQLAQAASGSSDASPEDVASAKQFVKLLSALKLSAKGKTFSVAFDYPSEEVVNLIKQEIEKNK